MLLRLFIASSQVSEPRHPDMGIESLILHFVPETENFHNNLCRDTWTHSSV